MRAFVRNAARMVNREGFASTIDRPTSDGLDRARPEEAIGAAARGTQPPIAHLSTLLDALHAAGMRYCHWKSNIRLDRSLRGQTDLDLLVHRDEAEAFRHLLQAFDLKGMVPPVDQRLPDTEHYLGFDAATGRLFHLHVHYSLILGEQFLKNHHLPLETEFLESAGPVSGVMVPAPEWELAVLVARILLRTRLSHVLHGWLTGKSGVPGEFIHEVRFLLTQASIETVAHVLRRRGDVLPESLVVEFLTRVVEGHLSAFDLWRLRNAAAQAMSRHRRDGRSHSLAARYARSTVQRRLLPALRAARPKQTLPAHGLTIALVGADGSGKSTHLARLCKWLGWKLKVQAFYMGSKRPSGLTRFFAASLALVRLSQRAAARLGGRPAGRLAALVGRVAALVHGLYSLALGWDRYSRAKAGRRAAAQGQVVLFDRYPLGSFAAEGDAWTMDGPQIGRDPSARPEGLLALLARWEKAMYARIPPADRLVLLEVNPAVSVDRKPDHRRERLEARNDELSRVAGDGAFVRRIDANQALEVVSLEIQRAVWSWL